MIISDNGIGFDNKNEENQKGLGMKNIDSRISFLEGTIKITSRLQGMPQYVLDYVLLHELVHLVVNDHGKDFDAFMKTFEKKERAEGYLDALDELPSSVWSSGSLGAIPADSNADISRGA